LATNIINATENLTEDFKNLYVDTDAYVTSIFYDCKRPEGFEI